MLPGVIFDSVCCFDLVDGTLERLAYLPQDTAELSKVMVFMFSNFQCIIVNSLMLRFCCSSQNCLETNLPTSNPRVSQAGRFVGFETIEVIPQTMAGYRLFFSDVGAAKRSVFLDFLQRAFARCSRPKHQHSIAGVSEFHSLTKSSRRAWRLKFRVQCFW
jgi:hypothetical protein